MLPKISIVTITFNSEHTVEETIKSVISQDYPNLEYIIIDGASKDGTLAVVDKYRGKIAKVISEPDNGISDAFNKGIRHSTGDIIGIINSDDVLLPEFWESSESEGLLEELLEGLLEELLEGLLEELLEGALEEFPCCEEPCELLGFFETVSKMSSMSS